MSLLSVNLLEMKSMARERGGRERLTNFLVEDFESDNGQIDHRSPRLLRDVFEAFYGSERLVQLMDRDVPAVALMESDAIAYADFANIVGAQMFAEIKKGYERRQVITGELCTEVQTKFRDGERIPYVSDVGNKLKEVGELQDYPEFGLTEEYLDTPRLKKAGGIISIDREVVLGEKTGLALQKAANIGDAADLFKQTEVLNVFSGATNNYKRNGTSYNTYLTSGAWINQVVNPLAGGDEWKAVERAELLFDAMVDPNTGEPIAIMPDTLVVPTALLRTANRIVTASEVTHVDNRANAVTVRTTSANPYGGSTYKVVSSPYIKHLTGSSDTWYFGQPKRAIQWRYLWDKEVVQARPGSEREFERDVVVRHKVSMCGAAFAYDPRYLTKNTAS